MFAFSATKSTRYKEKLFCVTYGRCRWLWELMKWRQLCSELPKGFQVSFLRFWIILENLIRSNICYRRRCCKHETFFNITIEKYPLGMWIHFGGCSCVMKIVGTRITWKWKQVDLFKLLASGHCNLAHNIFVSHISYWFGSYSFFSA